MGAKCDTMGRFLVDFFLRVVRSKVTAATVVRMTRLFSIKIVTQVTG